MLFVVEITLYTLLEPPRPIVLNLMYGRWFTSTTAFPFCLGDLGDDGVERPRILGGGGTALELDSVGTFRG